MNLLLNMMDLHQISEKKVEFTYKDGSSKTLEF